MLRYLIEKEFKQLKRNSFLPRLILLFPCVMMLVMPWAATLEIEDLRIAVIDHDHRAPTLGGSAGAGTGYGFPEDGLRWGTAVVESMGVAVPWRDAVAGAVEAGRAW